MRFDFDDEVVRTGRVTTFNLRQFEEGGRSWGFLSARVGDESVKLWFGTNGYCKPLGTKTGIFPDEDMTEQQIKSPPQADDLLAFRLGHNRSGQIAARWCWQSQYDAAQRQAIKTKREAERRQAQMEVEEREALLKEAAEREAVARMRERYEAEAAERRRLNPETIAVAEKAGWYRNESACHGRTVVMLLDTEDGKKKSKTFILPPPRDGKTKRMRKLALAC